VSLIKKTLFCTTASGSKDDPVLYYIPRKNCLTLFFCRKLLVNIYISVKVVPGCGLYPYSNVTYFDADGRNYICAYILQSYKLYKRYIFANTRYLLQKTRFISGLNDDRGVKFFTPIYIQVSWFCFKSRIITKYI
jgi:hypothetical protein